MPHAMRCYSTSQSSPTCNLPPYQSWKSCVGLPEGMRATQLVLPGNCVAGQPALSSYNILQSLGESVRASGRASSCACGRMSPLGHGGCVAWRVMASLSTPLPFLCRPSLSFADGQQSQQAAKCTSRAVPWLHHGQLEGWTIHLLALTTTSVTFPTHSALLFWVLSSSKCILR